MIVEIFAGYAAEAVNPTPSITVEATTGPAGPAGPNIITIGTTVTSGGSVGFLLSSDGSKVAQIDPATFATKVHTHPASDITGLAKVATSGAYNDLSGTPGAYTLPTASAGTLGGIRIGSGLAVDGSGIASVTVSGGTPGGSPGQLQWNNGGAFGGVTGSTVSNGAVTLTSGFSSAGAGTGSERYGAGASTGTTTQSLALGFSSLCTGDQAVAIGWGSSAAGSGVAIGRTASTTGSYAVSIGWNVSAQNGVVIGVESTNSTSGVTVGYQCQSPSAYYQNLFGRGLSNTLPAVNHSCWFGSIGDAGSSQTFGYAGRTSTSARPMYSDVAAWLNSTDATRQAQVTREVWDASARTVARDYTDGSRGYRAQTVHTTAPADADLQNGEVCFYTNGSGHLVIKLKDSSGTVRTGTVTLT